LETVFESHIPLTISEKDLGFSATFYSNSSLLATVCRFLTADVLITSGSPFPAFIGAFAQPWSPIIMEERRKGINATSLSLHHHFSDEEAILLEDGLPLKSDDELLPLFQSVMRKDASPRFAICLNGQLRRLELGSKIHNMLVPNLRLGVEIDLFVLLDPAVTVKQSTKGVNLNTAMFNRVSPHELRAMIVNHTLKQLSSGVEFNVFVEYLSTSNHTYEMVGNVTPVTIGGIDRFEMNFAMLASIRECARHVFARETADGKFYDFVIRLREDSYIFSPWILDISLYKNSIADIKAGGQGGLNDHTLIVARRWADQMFRGPIEDYYLHSNGSAFGNTERLLFQTALANNIPISWLHLCELPLIPLRGLLNSTHWKLHDAYASFYLREVMELGLNDPVNKTCLAGGALQSRTALVLSPDASLVAK
jgi:hypothetical protein